VSRTGRGNPSERPLIAELNLSSEDAERGQKRRESWGKCATQEFAQQCQLETKATMGNQKKPSGNKETVQRHNILGKIVGLINNGGERKYRYNGGKKEGSNNNKKRRMKRGEIFRLQRRGKGEGTKWGDQNKGNKNRLA